MADKKYITRGALLECSNGTHCRRLNLIDGHEIEIDFEGAKDDSGKLRSSKGKKHPFMLDCDTKIDGKDSKYNISWFGVCKQPNYSGKDVTLKPDPYRVSSKNQSSVSGTKCEPKIKGKWQKVKKKVKVNSPNGTGCFLTTDSYLVCDRCGGIIRFVTDKKGNTSDGTDYWDEQDQ